jgi:hypothetical protein
MVVSRTNERTGGGAAGSGADVAGVVRRLIVECALAVGHSLVVRVDGVERPVRPEAVEAASDGGPPVLRAVDALTGVAVSVPLDGPVRIDRSRLSIERVAQDGFAVGDAVEHRSFGIGVVQAVRGGGGGALADVRFATAGKRTLVLPRAQLAHLTHDGALVPC